MPKTIHSKYLVLIVLANVVFTHQNIEDNTIDDGDNDPLKDIASEILNKDNMQNIGAAVSNMLQSGGGKELGDAVMNMVGNKNAGDLLQNVASMFGNAGKEGGLNPNILTSLLSIMAQQKEGERNNIDIGGLLATAASFLGQQGNGEMMADLLPMLLQTVADFSGPAAEERAKAHEGHSWMLPPGLEKLHILFDHLVNSEIGKRFIASLGGDKFIQIFMDDNGNFDYDKFVELMENHSFRRHWIRQVTDQVGSYISHFTDPDIQTQYMTSGQFFINSFLKSQGFPKHALLDHKRPVETVSNLINHISRTTFDFPLKSKPYVKPPIDYITEVFRMARSSTMGLGNKKREISDKLADTINLELIEPFTRVNRAFKFARKVPVCDKYVMCLINENAHEGATLPDLKRLLYRSTSMIASWFLSGHTGTPFWSLYTAITDSEDCKVHFMESCHDFHIEELKVTTEYVHNEL